MANILAIVAHPDDESLLMGGTLALHAKANDRVHVVALSYGVGSRHLGEGDAFVAEWLARQDAFGQACQALGVVGHIRPVFRDQRADQVAQLEINRAVEIEVRTFQPSRVYTHFVGDLNLDHRRVAEAVLVATRLACPVWCAEPEFPGRAVMPWPWQFNIEPIAHVLDVKIAACLAYGQEVREYPHPRSERAWRERTEEHFVVYA